MRLDEEQAAYLEGLLRSRRHVLIVVRRGVKEGTVPEGDAEGVEEQLKFIDHMLAEIERCQIEKGWPSGQLQR
jgi:hypothetical protein